MNKEQLLQQAKRIVDERRFYAEDKAEQLLTSLRENADFTTVEHQLRAAQVDLAMGTGDAKQLQKKVNQLQKKQSAFLSALGLSTSDLTPQYHCHKCGDTGYVDGKACSCLQEEIRKLIVADSNIINRNYTFANSKETDKHNLAVYKMARKVCLDGKTNMLLTGNTGSGKTYLLTACANLCMEHNLSVLFVTAYTLNTRFLDAHLSDFSSKQMILDNLLDVDVLIIDDLGTETGYKNVTAEYLFAVLNERIARGKQTFISTNLPLDLSQAKRDELAKLGKVIVTIRGRYDERMFSRLVDPNTTFVAELQGCDKRLKKN
ncbi:MAG: ATP-binding protein [Clostridiales bacterium]|nr:ATP-binding protein [Clostridiales bacterium]